MVFDKWYLINSISAVTNYNSSPCLKLCDVNKKIIFFLKMQTEADMYVDLFNGASVTIKFNSSMNRYLLGGILQNQW